MIIMIAFIRKEKVMRWEEFSCWLKAQRKQCGLTQREAGNQIGMSGQQWCRYENAISPIRQGTVVNLARALGIVPEEALAAAGYEPVPSLVTLFGASAESSVQSRILTAYLEFMGIQVDCDFLKWLFSVETTLGIPVSAENMPVLQGLYEQRTKLGE